MSEELISQKVIPFVEDFALLIEAGFVAVKQLDEISARRLFAGASILKPSHTAPAIGFGYIALNKMQIKEAANLFQRILTSEPENQLAQMFLGISFLLSKNKRKKGEKLISEVMEKTDDPSIINLGKLSLVWSEKELSKSGKLSSLVELPEDA